MSHVQAFVRESDTLSDQIMGNLDDIIWSLALPSLTPIYFNAAAARIYQVSCAELIKNERLWLAAIAIQDQFKMKQAIAQAQELGSSQLTYRIYLPNGEMRCFSARLKIFKDTLGVPTRLDAIAQDVSENIESDRQKIKLKYKQTEAIIALKQLNEELEMRIEQRTKALQHSESHLKAAQRIGKLGSWEFDLQTGNVIWSEEVFRIFGRDPKFGAPTYPELQNIVHPDDWEYLNQTVENAIAIAQSYDIEYRVCWADGTLIYVLARGEIICDLMGKPLQIIGTAMDISDRKLAEAALSQSHDLREAIFNESSDALFLVDSQTLLTTDCNRQAVQLFEAADKAELIGIEGHILQRHQFSDTELVEINLEIQTQGFWSREVEYVTRKSRYFWGNLAAKPITIAGRTINLVRVTDISDRKLAEAQILRTSHQLENTNRELESFCYSVSHDLRAPLRHMNGFVNALQQQLQKNEALDDIKVTHYIQVIEKSSQKMGQLIDGLLTLSRYGRRPLESQKVSIRQLVEEAIEIICIDPNHNSLVKFAIGDLPTVFGDPILLQQVFCNLISNAVKFSRNQPHPYIEIDSLPNKPNNIIRIKDNGVGFQMEYADKLFGVFQRLHTDKEFEGTGIGLAIVQRIVQRHGGSIWAEGYPNQGAIFFLKI